MRLHSLSITAFGPFAETSTVDFDSLCDAGLFLLSGPTGSGKSSVLDAVCFALYGDVPGDRGDARRLRCDQSPPTVAPRVVLEATLAGRRFSIDRSPAWTRPKRRGAGTTSEQARVAISELVGEEWLVRSTRLDETGHLVTDLLGLTMSQFCQVALLPQGQFQAFLRAKSETRQALLQRVFRTGRFEKVERWLREHRTQLRHQSTECTHRVSTVVSRLSETTGLDEPTDWTDELDAPAILDDWAARALEDATATLSRATQRLEVARTAAENAERTLADATDLRRRVLRLQEAAAQHAALSEHSGEHSSRQHRLDAAQRAAPLNALLVHAERAEARRDRTADVHAAASQRWHGSLAHAHRPEAEAHRDVLLTEQAEVARLAQRLEALGDWQQEITSVDDSLAQLTRATDTLGDDLTALPQQLSIARTEVEAARAASQQIPDLARNADVAQVRTRQAAEAQRLSDALAQARLDAAASTEALHAAKEHWLDLRELRLEGMAAEIASALVVGEDCPVCGSLDHPQPARAPLNHTDAATEADARKRLDDLESQHLARTEHVRSLSVKLATARAGAGDVDELPALLVTTQRSLDAARRAATDLPRALHRFEQLEAREHELRTRLAHAGQEHAALSTNRALLVSTIEQAESEVQAFLDRTGSPDLVEARRVTEASLALVDEVLRAAADHDAALEAHRQAESELSRALTQHGFADLDGAREVMLDPAELAELRAAVDEHNARLAGVRATLMDPELFGLDDVSPPDLPPLSAAHERARGDLQSAAAQAASAGQRHARTSVLSSELGEATRAWRPVRDAYETAVEVSSFAEGKHPDNRLQMRLSAYVLAHRLGQVVDAANLRLRRMSDQRYTLEHSGRRGAGEQRGGLSLLIRDAWSGESRDPVTLSGGETFVVSLALALGLADVITHEAGGADLDTLFVDEGFGSLDADTLDDVLDTLDGLRDGGRVVGVVSHVPEMQTRIPAQLRVSKARTGSTLAHTTA